MTREALLLEKARAQVTLAAAMIAHIPEETSEADAIESLADKTEAIVDRIFRHVEQCERTPEPKQPVADLDPDPQPLRVGTMADVKAGRAELPWDEGRLGINLIDAHLIPWRPWHKYWAVDADGSYWRYVSRPERIGTASSWSCFPTREETSTTPISERVAALKRESMDVWTSMSGPRLEGAPEASP